MHSLIYIYIDSSFESTFFGYSPGVFLPCLPFFLSFPLIYPPFSHARPYLYVLPSQGDNAPVPILAARFSGEAGHSRIVLARGVHAMPQFDVVVYYCLSSLLCFFTPSFHIQTRRSYLPTAIFPLVYYFLPFACSRNTQRMVRWN